MATTKTLEQRLKLIEEKLQKLNNTKQQLKNKHSKEKRARDNRRKIIVGALILSEALNNKETKDSLDLIISKNVLDKETIALIEEFFSGNENELEEKVPSVISEAIE